MVELGILATITGILARAAFLVGALIFLVLLPLCLVKPFWFVRCWLWLLTHTVYRLRVRGQANVPREGGGYVVCGAVLHLDWLLLQAACPRRIRFLLVDGFSGFPGRWFLRRLQRWCGAFLIEPDMNQDQVDAVLRAAGEAVTRGELVGVFTQGFKTRRECTMTYSQVLARLQEHGRAPCIGVSLDQTWGSLFLFDNGRFVLKRPQELPAGVEATFGPALPPEASPGEARQAVAELSAAAAIARNPSRRPVHRQFVRMAASHPFRPCLYDGMSKGPMLSYGKALAGAMCLTKLLRSRLGAEQNVAVWLPPGTGGVLANIALAFLGKTSVNLNYTSSPEGNLSCLRQAGCKQIITARRFTQRMPLNLPVPAGNAEQNGDGTHFEFIHLDELMPLVGRWQKLWAFLKVLLLPGWFLDHILLGLGRHSSRDVATLIFSSGSTGDPKGVMLSHGNIAANVESMVQAIQLNPKDRLLGVLPLFHSFGYTVTLWAPLQVGASTVYYPDPRASREIGELSRTQECSIFLSTATFLRFCLRKCEPDDFRTIRVLICGAEKLPVSLAQDFQQRFGVLPLEGYGCTELSPASATNVSDLEGDGFGIIFNRFGTIGTPFPGCAARIVHPETLEPLPLGEEGLVLMTGANVMLGYLHKPELTAQVIRDGWYITGDMGSMDSDGYITLTGRLSRFAKVGGEMVPLEKVEEELHLTLHTAERVCSVTCVPDPTRGERIIVLYLTGEEVNVPSWHQQLKRRGLPALWVPSERDFHPVEELPVLGSGKVDLRRVKEMALRLQSEPRGG